jgi:hypothetical protein
MFFRPGEILHLAVRRSRRLMTAIYLLILGVFALDHHPHWNQLHPWTIWFLVLVLAAVVDLVAHRSLF